MEEDGVDDRPLRLNRLAICSHQTYPSNNYLPRGSPVAVPSNSCVANPFCQLINIWGIKNVTQGQLDAKSSVCPSQSAGCKERVTPEIEEIIVQPDRVQHRAIPSK